MWGTNIYKRGSLIPRLSPCANENDKLFQALSRFSVLEATESWAGPGNKATNVAHDMFPIAPGHPQ